MGVKISGSDALSDRVRGVDVQGESETAVGGKIVVPKLIIRKRGSVRWVLAFPV